MLERKLNALLERLEILKIDPKLLAKIVGKDRTIEQATRSEKRAASLGLHSLRHTNTTAMDSLSIPQQIRKQRLGHSGNSVTENSRAGRQNWRYWSRAITHTRSRKMSERRRRNWVNSLALDGRRLIREK